MDERMKRKYTEMVFHFFQEYFPGTRIYEGKCRTKTKSIFRHESWIMIGLNPLGFKPQKQPGPPWNQFEPNFFCPDRTLKVSHFYYFIAVLLCWARWLIIVMNYVVWFLFEFNRLVYISYLFMHNKDLVVSIDDLRENFIKGWDLNKSTNWSEKYLNFIEKSGTKQFVDPWLKAVYIEIVPRKLAIIMPAKKIFC